MLVKIDLSTLIDHFFYFSMSKFDNVGIWFSPKETMKEYWPYCTKVLVYGEPIIPDNMEKYDGSQEKIINFECFSGENIMHFEFPDEETALYFQMKFCSC